MSTPRVATAPALHTSRESVFSDWRQNAFIVTIITAISSVAMLLCATPELWWDEADYALQTSRPFRYLWSSADYSRHRHGSLFIYLAKLGQDLIPAGWASIEVRLRFFEVLIASFGVGFLYFLLRKCFGTSRMAALVGSGLLLFSVIRLEETQIVGPHHLMLVCALGTLGLGYYWRDSPTWRTATALGALFGFGAVSMTYVVPVFLCWVLAVAIAGREWIARDNRYLKVSWPTVMVVGAAAIFVLLVWPPGILQRTLLADFKFYMHYPPFTTLIGNGVYVVPPRWAFLWWMEHLDAPILIASAAVIAIAMGKAIASRRFSAKHVWLTVCIVFFVGTALSAHIAGPRNLLLVLGVLCLATGALFDEVFGSARGLARAGVGIAIVLAAGLNLLWMAKGSSWVPYLKTDGYRALIRENRERLHEKVRASVYGTVILNFYAGQEHDSVGWKQTEYPWSPLTDPLPAETKYALVPEFMWTDTPPDNLTRTVVAKSWKVVWSYKRPHEWELRLYENPELAAR